MSPARVLLIGFVLISAWAAWPRRETGIDTHWATRRFVIQSTIARFNEPIIILGDSIVEASTLPHMVCGHAIINAGIGGSSTNSKLQTIITDATATNARLIVVSLGLNDAARPTSVEKFITDYRSLLSDLKNSASRLAIMSITPIESGFEQSEKIRNALIDDYNRKLPELAADTGASLIPLPSMPARHTSDGIHLDARGYAVWDAALLENIESLACEKKDRLPAP